MTQMLFAVRATSGMFRMLVDPLLVVMLMPCCQLGILYLVLMPPPVASDTRGNQLQVVSETQVPPGPLVVNVVPPTLMMLVTSTGDGMDPAYAPLSPQALK